jgi:hypothetical protein
LDRIWTPTEIAYLAGIIDGEGCFAMHRRRGTHIFGTQLQIGNTDVRMLHWVREHFGGSVKFEKRSQSHHKPMWRWASATSELESITRAVLPFLIVKREQAELFLAYRATVSVASHEWRRKDGAPESVKVARQRIHAKLSTLNQRGVPGRPIAVND